MINGQSVIRIVPSREERSCVCCGSSTLQCRGTECSKPGPGPSSKASASRICYEGASDGSRVKSRVCEKQRQRGYGK